MSIEITHDKGPRCPYCHQVDDPDEAFYFTDDRIEIECGYCEYKYEFTYHRTDSWRSKPANLPTDNDKESDL